MNISIARVIFAVVLLYMLIASGFGQSPPVKWQRYELLENGVSANFPKLPLIIEDSDICSHQARRTYYAYTDDAVYHISVVLELKGDDSFCGDRKNKFNAIAFEERKKEFAGTAVPSDTSISGKPVTRFVGKATTTLLFDDLKNNRWLEVAVSSHDPLKRDSTEFASSVKMASKGGGAYIGQGANSMIGDSIPKDSPTPSEAEMKDSKEFELLILVGKTRAKYTDAARTHNEQGSVVLKVEFRADGTIGNIELLKSLKFGLTEQALAAANRIAFVPARYKGLPVRVIKTVEYGFSIY